MISIQIQIIIYKLINIKLDLQLKRFHRDSLYQEKSFSSSLNRNEENLSENLVLNSDSDNFRHSEHSFSQTIHLSRPLNNILWRVKNWLYWPKNQTFVQTEGFSFEPICKWMFVISIHISDFESFPLLWIKMKGSKQTL